MWGSRHGRSRLSMPACIRGCELEFSNTMREALQSLRGAALLAVPARSASICVRANRSLGASALYKKAHDMQINVWSLAQITDFWLLTIYSIKCNIFI